MNKTIRICLNEYSRQLPCSENGLKAGGILRFATTKRAKPEIRFSPE